MTGDEKVTAAFETWINEEDPPPMGITVGDWIRIATQYSPEELTIAELNAAGLEAWSDYWPQQEDPGAPKPDIPVTTEDFMPKGNLPNHEDPF
jgi:hypothetical protein